MATTRIKDMHDIWHDFHDSRLPDGSGEAGEIPVWGNDGKMIWAPTSISTPDDIIDFASERPVMNKCIDEACKWYYNEQDNIIEILPADPSKEFMPLSEMHYMDSPIYGFTATGQLVTIGTIPDRGYGLVGGTIFYIDDTVDEQYWYRFYDKNGNLLPNPKVGDKVYGYKTNAPHMLKLDVRKYYVVLDEWITLRNSYTWTYRNEDGSPLYENTESNYDSGYMNTKELLRVHEEYAKKSGTLWHVLQNVRNDKKNGCDDWFIPSKKELEWLIAAVDEETGRHILDPEDERYQQYGFFASSNEVEQFPESMVYGARCNKEKKIFEITRESKIKNFFFLLTRSF